MIRISSSNYNEDVNGILDIQKLEIRVIDSRFESGVIDHEDAYFDLRQLAALRIISETPDIEKRRASGLARQQAKSRSQNQRLVGDIATGTLVGGAIDFMIGNDDSILDGMAIGAALYGGLTQSSGVAFRASSHLFTSRLSRLDLTEGLNTVAILIFRNGDSIRYNVDVDGIAQLYQVMAKIEAIKDTFLLGPALCHRPLSPAKLAEAKQVQVSKQIISIREKN